MTPSSKKKVGADTLREYQAVLVPRHATAGRVLENIGFALGILYALSLGAIELLDRAGLLAHPHRGFPLVSILILTLLVAPKVLGRATAGAVWQALAKPLGGIHG